ncbi:MAG: mandelate racemase/muconate lactonizing enzyme family protein [Planctomycetota bacterium]
MPTPKSSIRSASIELSTESYRYRTPMKFGGRVVEDVTVLNAHCQLGNHGGQNARGLGSMTMGVAWAWPSPDVTDGTKLLIVQEAAEAIANLISADEEGGHPMEVCVRSHGHFQDIAAKLQSEHGLQQPIPDLAMLLAASPVEAALFDAHGLAAGCSAYQLLGREHLTADIGTLLHADQYNGLHLSNYINTSPSETLPLYHLVGALDPLSDVDVATPVQDGLPETLDQWIRECGLSHLKIKLAGDDADWDLQRVVSVDHVAQSVRRDTTGWQYSLDFNERCEDEDYVLELLDRLKADHSECLQRVAYIEQPTHRDLKRPNAVTMHRAAARIPVVIDESLTDLESAHLAMEQGYSGIALKACKGHSEALLLGAIANHHELFLCVQDLTCVGASLLHSASIAAHIPGVTAIESNGRQYCPQGNAAWLDTYEPFFQVRNGRVPTGVLNQPGLGFRLP